MLGLFSLLQVGFLPAKKNTSIVFANEIITGIIFAGENNTSNFLLTKFYQRYFR